MSVETFIKQKIQEAKTLRNILLNVKSFNEQTKKNINEDYKLQVDAYKNAINNITKGI